MSKTNIIIFLVEAYPVRISDTIINDLASHADLPPTETNWYFYGSGVNADDIGSNILPAIMIRKRENQFTTNFSISDHDFALNIDRILAFKIDLENHLKKYEQA